MCLVDSKTVQLHHIILLVIFQPRNFTDDFHYKDTS